MRLVSLARDFYRRLSRDDVSSYAAALTYNLIFAVFPLGLVLTGLLSRLHLPSVENALLRLLRVVLADEVVQFVSGTILAPQHSGASAALIGAGALGYLWGMSTAFRHMIQAFNRAYAYGKALRAVWKTWLLSFALAAGLGLAVLAIASAVAFTPLLVVGPLRLLGSRTVVGVARAVLALALALLGLDILYWAGPDRPRPFLWFSPGAAFALGVWLAASLGFSLYLGHFNAYNRIYGTFGAVILTVLYLYITAYAVLLGGEVNAMAEGAGEGA